MAGGAVGVGLAVGEMEGEGDAAATGLGLDLEENAPASAAEPTPMPATSTATMAAAVHCLARRSRCARRWSLRSYASLASWRWRCFLLATRTVLLACCCPAVCRR